MSFIARMSGWVHRSHPPVHQSSKPIVDPIICWDCMGEFDTLAQYHLHNCPAEP